MAEETISEREAEERYKDHLDDSKEEWIKNYYGGDVLKEIDPIAYRVGFSDFIDWLSEDGIKVEGWTDE